MADEPSERPAFLAYGLRQRGHAVWIVDTAARALDAVQRYRTQWLVTNVALRDGSGLTLLRRLRQSLPVRGIALASVDVDVPFMHAAGFDAVWIKPLSIAHACMSIERLLGHHPSSSATTGSVAPKLARLPT
ncbi:hypothetical protein [Pendulispora albinea]|uniref:Response regulatory domain-containing protein n=1 Tax=Pendulispora albinea TaxID=2741071 RepID=A0ABZ2LT15_9BACT